MIFPVCLSLFSTSCPKLHFFCHKLCPQYRFRVYMFYLREGCCCLCRWCLEGLNVRPLGHLHYSPGWAALSSAQADAFTSAIWTIIAAYPSSVCYTSRSELFAPDSSWWRTDDAVPRTARFHSRVQPELSSETFCQCQWLPCPKYSPEDCSGLKGRRFWRCWLLNMSTVLLVLSSRLRQWRTLAQHCENNCLKCFYVYVHALNIFRNWDWSRVKGQQFQALLLF